MRKQEGARQRAVGHAAEVVGELVGKYSNLANMKQGTKPQKLLAAFMDLTSVPLGFAAGALQQGLKVAEDVSLKGTYLGVGSTSVAYQYFFSKGFGRDNPAGKKREEELKALKTTLSSDIDKLGKILEVINDRGASVDVKTQIQELLGLHPSSKLIKAMTKFEKDMRGKTGDGRIQDKAYTNLALAIDDELSRLQKLVHTETKDLTGFKKVITELHNWFKDIMLSFRESKLQGLKHVALGFGEVLFGIGAVVATLAAAAFFIPVVAIPSFGINLATRITSFLAGVCVLAITRLYNAFAAINSALFLPRNDQQAFEENTRARVEQLDRLQKRLFDLAMKTPSKGEPENLSSDPYTSKGEVKQHSVGGSEQQVSFEDKSAENQFNAAVGPVVAAASGQGPESILQAGINPD